MVIRHYKAGLNFLWPLQICFIKENYDVSWKKSLDYNMYEKSRLVDFLFLMIYQHKYEPFKIIGVFNYYNMLSLTSCKGRLLHPEMILFIC